jgi:NAD(P)-dependent dehydrogenase (short-subunit alcohol dehydrogenase family)
MNTIVIAGGNSGVGLQAARECLAAGHRVILLGRDQRKGEGSSAFNWNKPGDFQHGFAIRVDAAIQKAVVDASREVTGV